jgi:hypothetical protein
MKEVAWMTGASVAAWLVATATVAAGARVDVLCGMLAPLVMAAASWVLAEQTFRTRPQALTGLMIGAFGIKLVFFGAYVVVMLRIVRLQPVPFAVSFSSYFIALHLVEAMFLKRLFAGGPRA